MRLIQGVSSKITRFLLHDCLASLRVRVVVLVLSTLFPIVGFTLYSAVEQRQHARIGVQQEALRSARLAASNHEQCIESTRQLLISLAQLPAIRQHDTNACQSFLSRLLEQHWSYDNLNVADVQGNIFCSAFPIAQPANISTRPYFQRALQTRVFTVGEYQIGYATGKANIVLAYPFLDESSRPLGVVSASLDLSWLNRFAAGSQLAPGASLFVIDRNGTILVRYPDTGNWIGKPMPGKTLVRTILSTGEGVTEDLGGDDISRLYAYTPLSKIPGSELYLSIGIPDAVAFAEADGSLRWELVTLGGITLLALAGAWILGDWMVMRNVHSLVQATERLSDGELKARTGLSHDGGELGLLADAFDQMAEKLEQRQAEHDQAEQHIMDLLRKAITAQEEERNRIARELHDETAQGLTLLMLDLDLGRRAEASDPVEADRHFWRARSTSEETLTNLRRIIADLRPSILDDLGLVPAIAWYGEKRLKPEGIDLKLQGNALEERLPEVTETALFRIAQEALTNVLKHADASQVTVSLDSLDGHLIMQVEDDGKGFKIRATEDARAGDGGMGLPGIRERAALLGGEFELRTEPGQGTKITVRIPKRFEGPDD